MKKLLSPVFTAALLFSSCHDHFSHAAPLAQEATQNKIAGKWQLSMETPHGTIKGPFQVDQDGSKLKATLQTEMFGTASVTGELDGSKVAFHVSVPGGPQSFTFTGTVDGAKMSGKTEMDGDWSATREAAQSAAATTVLGKVTDFRVDSLELGVKPDSGPQQWVKFSTDTEVVVVSPGEHDLTRARPAKITDIAREDRVLVSFVAGMPEARRIVLISETAIQRRDMAERLDWANRGISGVVSARDGDQITLETRTPLGAQHTTLVVTPKTAIRRYAPDSVKFADAQPASLHEIVIGDQVRTRGDKSEDGSRLTADDIVFGTFLTTLGTIQEVNREHGEIIVLDGASKKPLTVRLTADTQMKKLPDMQHMQSGHAGAEAPASIAQMLQQLPSGSLDDLKVGASVVVTSTRGTHADRVTGIMVLANVDGLLQMAQSQAPGASAMEALNRMHGGILGGPAGVSLPAILQ